MAKYYLTTSINCHSYEIAVEVIMSIPPQFPVGIVDNKDGTFTIDRLSDKPVQHGQHEYVGEITHNTVSLQGC